MAIVPHTDLIRRRSRIYPGDLSQMSTVREDLRADLTGFDADFIDPLVLCASELVANAIEHSRSGDPDGHVVRALFPPTPNVLRLIVVDDGARESSPMIPTARTEEQWLSAERGRGLLMVDALATSWGVHPVVPFPFCADLGTAVWAEFAKADLS